MNNFQKYFPNTNFTQIPSDMLTSNFYTVTQRVYHYLLYANETWTLSIRKIANGIGTNYHRDVQNALKDLQNLGLLIIHKGTSRRANSTYELVNIVGPQPTIIVGPQPTIIVGPQPTIKGQSLADHSLQSLADHSLHPCRTTAYNIVGPQPTLSRISKSNLLKASSRRLPSLSEGDGLEAPAGAEENVVLETPTFIDPNSFNGNFTIDPDEDL